MRIKILVVILILLIGTPVYATNLAWDEVNGAAGYKIYYGTSSGIYVTPIDVGNVTTVPLPSAVQDGRFYYLAATAYDSGGGESDYSNEITWPIVTTITGGAVGGGKF